MSNFTPGPVLTELVNVIVVGSVLLGLMSLASHC